MYENVHPNLALVLLFIRTGVECGNGLYMHCNVRWPLIHVLRLCIIELWFLVIKRLKFLLAKSCDSIISNFYSCVLSHREKCHWTKLSKMLLQIEIGALSHSVITVHATSYYNCRKFARPGKSIHKRQRGIFSTWLCLTRAGNYRIQEFDWLRSILKAVRIFSSRPAFRPFFTILRWKNRKLKCKSVDYLLLTIFILSINLLAFYHECCSLIGYATYYLFGDK